MKAHRDGGYYDGNGMEASKGGKADGHKGKAPVQDCEGLRERIEGTRTLDYGDTGYIDI